MYTSFYNLNCKPFQIASDPNFIWLGEKHKEALATLTYGVMDNKGFMLLTGDVGTGKTTLINTLIKGLSDDILYASVPDPRLSLNDFLNYIANAFNIPKRFKSKGKFLIYFREFLNKAFEDNKKVLLLIDESQLLTQDLLEEIRLLSNIQRDGLNLLNIFFVGQDEFNEILERQENRAVAQRLTLNYHLKPLTDQETEAYIRHRLSVAGTTRQVFDAEAFMEIHRYSGGFPRRINILCDHCLLTGFVREQRVIGADVVRTCAQELKIPQYVKRAAPPERPLPPQFQQPAPPVVAQPVAVPLTRREPVAPVAGEPPPAAGEKLQAPGSDSREHSPSRPTAPLRPIPRRRPVSMVKLLTVLAAVVAAIGLVILYSYDRPTFERLYAGGVQQLQVLQERLLALPTAPSPVNGSNKTDAAPAAVEAVPKSGKTAETQAPAAAPAGSPPAQASPTAEKPETVSTPQRSEEVAQPPTGSAAGEPASQPVVGAQAPSPLPDTPPIRSEQAPDGTQATASAAGQHDDTAPNSAIVTEPMQLIDPQPKPQPMDLPEKTILVRFENDSSDFSFADLERVDDFVAAVRQHPEVMLVISGHTDSFGSEGYNYRLSLFRANVVKSFLLGKGIPSHQMRVQAFGSEKPLSANDTEQGRSMNRRVEIDILR